MQKVKKWKSLIAIVLSLAVLLGVVAASGLLFGKAGVVPSTKIFEADFAELTTLAAEAGATWQNEGAIATPYTVLSDTTSANGIINTYLGERFVSRTSYNNGSETYPRQRAWVSQKNAQLVADGSTNHFFGLSNGFLRYQVANIGGGEMIRRVDSLIPKVDGEIARFKNFEAEVVFTFEHASDICGSFLFGFHESKAGHYRVETASAAAHTGNTLVIGNPGKTNGDSWGFYDSSSATIPNTAITNGEAMGETRYLNNIASTAGEDYYTLKVKTLNGTATFTLTSNQDAAFVKELTKTYNTAGSGAISLGTSNRGLRYKSITITELDDNGDAVDYGTFHKSTQDGVSVFTADFNDVPGMVWNGSKYLVNNDGAAIVDKGTTYTATVDNKAMADYLESKFNFYTYANGGGDIVERWNAAGYGVDTEGNNVLKQTLSADIVNPSTGGVLTKYAPGYGVSGAWGAQYPDLKITENRWLQMLADYNGWSMTPFNYTAYVAVQDADGDEAVLKNFKLDLDFKLGSEGAKNQSPIFVKFGGYEGVTSGCTDGAMFAVAANGGYFLDDLSTTYSTGYGWDTATSAYVQNATFTANTFTKNITSDALNFPSYAGAAVGAKAALHLTLKVVNGKATAVVTNASGAVVLNSGEVDVTANAGKLLIGNTQAGWRHGSGWLGAVQVTRLDDDGNAVDFDVTEPDTDAFSASFVGLTDYLNGKYYRNNGTKNDSIAAGKVAGPWLTDGAAQFAFGEQDTEITAYLNDKFDFYHTALTGKLYRMDTPYQNTEKLQPDTHTSVANRGAYWVLDGGNRLRASFGAAGGELFRKSLGIAPKYNGSVINVSDFAAEFDYRIDSIRNGIYWPGAVAFTFRSAEVGKVTSATGGYADAVTLVFTREKMVLYDNVAADYTYADVQADENGLAWQNTTDVGAAHVSMRVAGDTLTLKVTSLDRATVYYDDTISLTRLYGGYVYFTALSSDVSLGGMTVRPLKAENYAAKPEGLLPKGNKIVGLDARFLYEYRLQDAENWTAVSAGATEITGLDKTAIYEVRLAATAYYGPGEEVALQMCTYDEENTVVYDFEDAAQMDDFDTWFIPTLTTKNAAISTTGTTDTNWYINNGLLKFKTNTMNTTPSAFKASEGVSLGGQTWKYAYASVYNSNMGVAVLNRQTYENFILDFDFTGSPYWTTVGFGAQNTADGKGVYWINENGGYTFFLENDGGKGAMDYYYLTANGLVTKRNPGYEYNGSGAHHMRVVVSDNKAYMSLDDQTAWCVDVPDSYTGGYIFFGLNNTTSNIDNVKITDLDAKNIEITQLSRPLETVELDRAADENSCFPANIAYGQTADGYEYPLLVDFEDGGVYRSYKDGTFHFDIVLKPTHNVTLADSFDDTLTVVNKVDYDTTSSRKYYFDHPNDFLDFGAYYSEKVADASFWYNKDDTEYGYKWTAYEGDLTQAAVTDKWTVTSAGTVSNSYLVDNGNASPPARMRNLSTMIYKGHQLQNFRLEYDVKKGSSSWWYNYSLIGVQDPTKYVYALHKWNASLSSGHNTSSVQHEYTKDAGVYAFMEQEGYFNIFGNIEAIGSDRINNDPITVDGQQQTFIADYQKDAWHHITIEVVDGVMEWRVDDSYTVYYQLDYNAYGGYVGFASHGSGSQFDNFQITALDENGNEVDIATAAQGTAKPHVAPVLPNWEPALPFVFDWSLNHKN